jgi:hypothetical protein
MLCCAVPETPIPCLGSAEHEARCRHSAATALAPGSPSALDNTLQRKRKREGAEVRGSRGEREGR